MASLALGLGGAEQRLLAGPVPALFFGLAAVAQVPAWAGLAAVADVLPWFAGGAGPVLAVVHTLTLGVLVSAAMGASLQMLPVALGQAAPSAGRCVAIFALLAAGLALLASGFALIEVRLLLPGGIAVVAAVVLYIFTLVRIIAAPPLVALKVHAGFAALSLFAAAAAALALVLSYRSAFIPDPAALALAHAVAAAFGFMGALVFGFGPVLLPMFAIAEPAGDRTLRLASLIGAAAVGLAVFGALRAAPPAIAAAAGLGLSAALLHATALARMLAKRMRRRLGPEFVFVAASWALLGAALVAAFLLALDRLPPTGPALVLVLVLYGWLLTLLVGVLQRILPFLASMHAARRHARPLLPTRLVDERALTLHRIGHFAALAALIPGIALAQPWAIRTAAAAGTIAAGAFIWFAGTVAVRARRHIRASAAAKR